MAQSLQTEPLIATGFESTERESTFSKNLFHHFREVNFPKKPFRVFLHQLSGLFIAGLFCSSAIATDFPVLNSIIRTTSAFDKAFDVIPLVGPTYKTGVYNSDPTKSTGGTWVSNGEIAVDWNGDGLMDFVDGGSIFPFSGLAGDYVKIKLRILINLGNGRFEDQADKLIATGVPQRLHFSDCRTDDFNRDGRPDLFCVGGGVDVTPFTGETAVYLLSGSDGKWKDLSSTLPQKPSFGHYAAVGQIKGDGVPHIFVVNIYGGTESDSYFLMNDGQGNLTQDKTRVPADMQATPGKWISAKLEDLDGDGFPDLVLGAGESYPLGQDIHSRVYFNDGKGYFTGTPLDLPSGCFQKNGNNNNTVPELTVADLDGDGLKDIVLASTQRDPFYAGGCLQVIMNKGKRVFVDETAKRIGKQPDLWVTALNVIDVNNDGFPDIVPSLAGNVMYGRSCPTGNACYGNFFVLMNDGTGKFSPSTTDFPELRMSWDKAGSSATGTYAGAFPIRLSQNEPVSYIVPITTSSGSDATVAYSLYKAKDPKTSSSTSTSTTTSDSDRVFNWAEKMFPSFFPKGPATQTYDKYTYRRYSNGNYLVTSNGRVIVHNGRDWNLMDVGALANFLPNAIAAGF